MIKEFFKDMLFLKFMPCHRKPERSMHFRGRQFPICYRCMFILAGYTAIIPFAFYAEAFSSPAFIIGGILLNIPMLLDGFTQIKKWRVSNNLVRSLTGLLSGVGMSIIIISLAVNLVQFIFNIRLL
ncbi:putative membrane protein [Cytobacillus oceanisediminis]|uniref:Putative membrane protein n=1 Tax=Cytobacillus oceanisediminis TaxID=665099 RepID=A0A2V3A5R9_9BACI|nr:DUF2085 domain-containing protein [Cytobacillus oceanisediminis]PWW30183.1 putative membrane protein [Cytobacillus oceanisediminis]